METESRWERLRTELVVQLALLGLACGLAGAVLGVSIAVSPSAHAIVGPLLCPGAEVTAATQPVWRGKLLTLECHGPGAIVRQINPDLVFLVYIAMLIMPSYLLLLLGARYVTRSQ